MDQIKALQPARASYNFGASASYFGAMGSFAPDWENIASFDFDELVAEAGVQPGKANSSATPIIFISVNAYATSSHYNPFFFILSCHVCRATCTERASRRCVGRRSPKRRAHFPNAREWPAVASSSKRCPTRCTTAI